MHYAQLEEKIGSIIEDILYIEDDNLRCGMLVLLQDMPETIYRLRKDEIDFNPPHNHCDNREYRMALELWELLDGVIGTMNDEAFEEFYAEYVDILVRQYDTVFKRMKIERQKAIRLIEKCFNHI
jgi:hypothetical protein